MESGVYDLCLNYICLWFLAVLFVVLADPDFRLHDGHSCNNVPCEKSTLSSEWKKRYVKKMGHLNVCGHRRNVPCEQRESQENGCQKMFIIISTSELFRSATVGKGKLSLIS